MRKVMCIANIVEHINKENVSSYEQLVEYFILHFHATIFPNPLADRLGIKKVLIPQ